MNFSNSIVLDSNYIVYLHGHTLKNLIEPKVTYCYDTVKRSTIHSLRASILNYLKYLAICTYFVKRGGFDTSLHN